MWTQLRPALVSLLLLTLLTGVAYPLLITGIARLVWADKADGSLIQKDGATAGSSLIGQPFDDPKYFWGRPSMTTSFPYNAASSNGSNLGPTNPDLAKAVSERVAALQAADPDNTAVIPIDLVTASGSGLDPHISPAAADYQVKRVARVRGMEEAKVRQIVARHTEGRTLGLFGEPRVNVLELNLDLDAQP
jgi:K+-transporting ATPase ATPase C chain